jgi:hypothetical protein
MLELLPCLPTDKCANRRCRHPRSDHGSRSKEGTYYPPCRTCEPIEAPDGDLYPRCRHFEEPKEGKRAR